MFALKLRTKTPLICLKYLNRANKRIFHIKSQYYKFPVVTKIIDQTLVQTQVFYSINSSNPNSLHPNEFNAISEATLESLTDYFEDIVEGDSNLSDSDVSYSSGVLTVNLGKHGTYVINKQTPNKQIWLSSPTSGPKRYDFIEDSWIYKHTGESLHLLLQEELSKIIKRKIDFTNCAYSKL